MNWPGAYCILERIGRYKDADTYRKALKQSIERAQAQEDKVWLDMLLKIQNSEDERWETEDSFWRDKNSNSMELGKEIYHIFRGRFGEDVFRETIDDCVVIARFIYTAKLWPSLQNEWK